jgi:hypothetical protein
MPVRPCGRRFVSLFNSYVGLLSSLEDSRNLLLVAYGCRGIAPLRAAIEWTPVQAHATAHRVNIFYVAHSSLSAAYLKDWSVCGCSGDCSSVTLVLCRSAYIWLGGHLILFWA